MPSMTDRAIAVPTKPSEKIAAWLLPSAPVLVFVLIFWMSLFFMPTMLNAGDGDLGRHIVTGNYILTTGQVPTHDIFSHTKPGAPYVPVEWLSEVLFALAYRAAGLNGVAWLVALVIASCYALLTWGVRRQGVSAPIALAGGVVAAIVGSIHALTRPLIITWLLFTIFLLVLENYRQNNRRRALLLLPVLMIGWVNFHGAFVSGLALVAIYIVGGLFEKKWKRALELAALWIALLLASLITPVGPGMLTHVLSTLQNRYLVDITVEFQSPNFHIISTWPFAALLLLSLAIAWLSPRRLEWTPLALLGGWTAFALYSARNIPLYALAAVMVLAPSADALVGEMLPAVKRFLSRIDEIDRRCWGWVWAFVIVVVLVGIEASGTPLDAWGRGNTIDPHVFPVVAIDTLKDSPPAGNVFNEFTWGGYLLYRMWPQQRVFIDGWADFYGDALTREYLQAVNAEPGWNAVLDRYNVQWVIIPPTRALAAQLDASPTWTRRYEDGTAGVWVRR